MPGPVAGFIAARSKAALEKVTIHGEIGDRYA
jgi:hypothetical protein